MTDPSKLERRYRRLLGFYPRAFREEHELEMMSVLMEGAAENQRRPGLAESADLIRSGSWMRIRAIKIPSAFEQRHPAVWIWVRILTGVWLVILTAILCQYDRWWGLALLLPAALHFFIANRLGKTMQGKHETGDPPSPPPPAARA
jgi:hypothetical protein